jgi:Tol biopolymer transport system component
VSSAPITSSKYFDRDPTWSPGGERIAFSRATSVGTDLWVRSLSTGEELVLRTGPGDEVCPRWSPDGRLIALLSTDLPGVPVVLVPPTAQGSGSERVLVETNARVFDIVTQWGTMGSRPWRSDGEVLLVARAVASGQTAVCRVATDDGSVEQLTFPPVGQSDAYPTYSFDEERVSFVRLDQGRATLMVMDADGDEPEVLLEAQGRMGLHSWRPDGEGILYIDSTGVWELDLATRAVERLLFASDQSSLHGELAMSNDGRIAYTYGGHDTILTSIDLEDRTATPLTNHIGTNFRPRISVRGEIGYMSDRTGDFEIWVRGSDDTERQITRSPGADGTPDWSPDGERIAFSSARDGTFRIYTTDRFGGDLRLVANEVFSTVGLGGVGLELNWSPASSDPDGEELIGCVLSSEGGLDLWGVRPDGTGGRLLFEGVEEFDWYLGSRRVIATLTTSRGEELVALHLETGELRTIWSGPHDEIDVSPDGRHVLFASGKGHASMGLALLELVPPDDPDGLPTANGEPVDLVRPDGPWHIHDGTWSPDAKTVVYVHDADWSNVHELIEAR